MVLAGLTAEMATLFYILVAGFIAGLAFAPAKDLDERIKIAGRIGLLVALVAYLLQLIFVRTLG